MPTKESQCRPLAKLSPERQREVWRIAVARAKGKVPSARLVKEAVEQVNSVNNVNETNKNVEASFSEVNYTAGIGVEYTVRLDEETYYRLRDYQDKIKTATQERSSLVRPTDVLRGRAAVGQ